jgi:hypothetical protein
MPALFRVAEQSVRILVAGEERGGASESPTYFPSGVTAHRAKKNVVNDTNDH